MFCKYECTLTIQCLNLGHFTVVGKILFANVSIIL